MGTEKMKTCYPTRHLLEKGGKLGLSTDAPATAWAVPADPFPNIKGAVTRKAWDGTDCGEDQAIDIETALILYTKESAEIAGFKGLGQLKDGYKADFLILDRALLELSPKEIDQLSVAATDIGGLRVYLEASNGEIDTTSKNTRADDYD